MPLLVEGATLGFWASAAPGPFQALLLAQAIRNGVSRTLPLAAVPLASDPVVIAAVVLVLGSLPEPLLRVLQVGGGVFLLWLAWGTLRAARAPAADAPGAGGGTAPAPRGFWRAALVNLTNPNAWIFWSLAGGPILVRAAREAPSGAVAFLGGFYAALVGMNLAVVVLFGAAGRIGPRVSRGLALVSGLALAGFGAWQVVRGTTGA